MCTSFDSLYGEPDIPAGIFSLLPERDLCQAELVCTQWRSLIIEQRVWRMKLEKYFRNEAVWNIILRQHQWQPGTILEHEEHKTLIFNLKSIIGPSQITDKTLTYITNDVDLNKPSSGNHNCFCNCSINCKCNNCNNCNCNCHHCFWQKTKKNSSGPSLSTMSTNPADGCMTWEENLFLTRRHNDHITLTSKMPLQSRARGAPWQKSFWQTSIPPRETNLSHDGEHYSNLILFSPTAFPIFVTTKGYVAVAGARYGKGKIVVVPHEAVLSHEGLMQGAIEWCTGTSNSPVFKDPLTKAWRGGGWSYFDVRRIAKDSPFPVNYLDRKELSGDIPVYITEGHYEDHADHLMEYVKQGGGLIIGGHAWWWAHNDVDVWNGQKCTMLDHPGNKIIARAGIVFSKEGIKQDNIWFQVDNIPALKHSLYYALKACISRPMSIFRQEVFDDLLKGTEYEETQLFSDRLRNNEYFNLILQYMYQIQTRSF